MHSVSRSLCLSFALAVGLAAPSFADDNGKELSPTEILALVPQELRDELRAAAAAEQAQPVIDKIADQTLLTEAEASFAAQMLIQGWAMKEKFNRRVDVLVSEELNEQQRKALLGMVADRNRDGALTLLQNTLGLEINDAGRVIDNIDERLVAAGVIPPAPAATLDPETVMSKLPLAAQAAILEHLAAGKKIAAIKELRAHTGLSLKNSKDIVDALQAEMN